MAAGIYLLFRDGGLGHTKSDGSDWIVDQQPSARALTHLEQLNTSMFRSLMRGSHLNCTGGLLINEFDSFGSDHRLMTELALAGEFRFVKGPTYFKRVHSQNLQMKFQHWSEERKRAAWAFFGAWMVEVIVPAGHSLEERWRLLNIVLDRFLVARGWLSFMRGRADWYEFSGSRERSIFVRAAINRIRKNGKLDAWLRKQRRGMFCQLSNSDAEVRAALLRNILDRLRANDKFDPSACLHSTWAVVETRCRSIWCLPDIEKTGIIGLSAFGQLYADISNRYLGSLRKYPAVSRSNRA